MPLSRPAPDEYSAYFGKYVDLVSEDDVLSLLAAQQEQRRALLGSLDEAQATHRYESGKWSLKELLGHLIDCERVFGYRALTACRGDGASVPGFEQDAWVAAARFDERPLGDLLHELELLRGANLALFASFDQREGSRCVESEGQRVSARAAAWILAGHERHHMDVVRTRYL